VEIIPTKTRSERQDFLTKGRKEKKRRERFTRGVRKR